MTRFSPAELADVFTDVGRYFVEQPDQDGVLQALSEVAVKRVPGAEYAGVTTGRAGRMSTAAATHERVRQTDDIQYELGSGPCVDAIVENSKFNARDLRTDPRWPEFGRRAVERTSIVSMLSFRLFFETDNGLIAALNMYAHQPNAFDETSETIGVLLATHGALALANAEARQRNSDLEVALASNRDIGVAIGILMALHKVTRDQAFKLLVIASQHTNRKLNVIAQDVIDTGALATVPSTS